MSHRSSSLAVGTSKGNLQLFNIRDKRRMPVVGKHTKKISCMCWNKENVLAAASLDKRVSGDC
jgi:WD repeat-containing protein 19